MLVRQRRHVERAAFTLMEIIVVVAIILILAGAGIVVYTNMLGDAKMNRAKMDVQSIEQAVMAYSVNNQGNLPDSLLLLTDADPTTGRRATLTESALKDPWGNDYVYEKDNLHPKTNKPRIYTPGEPGRGPFIDNWKDPNYSGG